MDRLVEVLFFVHVERLVYHDTSYGSSDRIAVLGGQHTFALLFGDEFVIEAGQSDFVAFERGDLHRAGELVVVVDELYLDGALRVERACPQPLLNRVVHGQVEALDHLLHQPARLENVDLVVDIAARLESGQVAEGLQLHVTALRLSFTRIVAVRL